MGRKICMQKRYPLWICIDSFKIYFFEFHCPLLEFRVTLQGVQQPQEQRYPFLPVCAVCSCVHTMVWLPVSGSFNVHTDGDASVCTRRLYGHRKKVCTEVDSGRNISCRTGDSNPRQYCTLLSEGHSVQLSHSHSTLEVSTLKNISESCQSMICKKMAVVHRKGLEIANIPWQQRPVY